MKRLFLDARELEHPEPLQKATQLLQRLDDAHYFYMLHRKEPIPLLEIAKGWGLKSYSKQDEQGQWHILIAKKDTDLEGLCDV